MPTLFSALGKILFYHLTILTMNLMKKKSANYTIHGNTT